MKEVTDNPTKTHLLELKCTAVSEISKLVVWVLTF